MPCCDTKGAALWSTTLFLLQQLGGKLLHLGQAVVQEEQLPRARLNASRPHDVVRVAGELYYVVAVGVGGASACTIAAAAMRGV